MSDALESRIDELFGPDGPLARAHPGYEPRAAQARMGLRVAQACADDGLLLLEAGTGTGKTIGYLLPLLAEGLKVVVSTATKALQDQIFEKDIPLLRRALQRPFSAATLKGRANYLCLHRYRQFNQAPYPMNAEERMMMRAVEGWAAETLTGDRDELYDLPERNRIWSEISIQGDNCLGGQCPDYMDCYLIQARARAREAELVVVNHHLFFADLAVKEGGFGEILPNYRIVVFDEAHQIPEVVTRFFGLEVSNYKLRELARDARREFEEVGMDDPEPLMALGGLEDAAAQLRSAFPQENHRAALGAADLEREPGRALIATENALSIFLDRLEPHRPRSAGIAACGRRAEALITAAGVIRTLDDPTRVYWFETRGKGVFLQASPIHVGDTLRGTLYPKVRSAVFASATLTTAEGESGFDYFLNQLGLDPEITVRENLPPVFDFANQSLLYLPRRLPEPTAPQFPQLALRELRELILASRGRALCLFTSYRMLEMAREALEGNIPYRLMTQGDAPKRALLEAFAADPHSVLLGTGTFWEGVDVPGEALSLVVIDRLPFASPGDPLTAARNRHIESQGGNAFAQLSIPQAILTLKQGIGRLLRSTKDRGVMAILDTRITRKGYGKRFIKGLPPARIVQDFSDVAEFFDAEFAAQAAVQPSVDQPAPDPAAEPVP
ncbi:ATP-dependent DNA helicase [Magnetofaba australis]|uniref:Putative helicase c2 n=1 Tax=Magnetofaba australis IT-1 TaxID=1434232 RepID=A0A1Y2K3W2_9PROT|nr:ATP-dependent DNA helicase [Magnetofaba australis]OSM02336.1 putative helicase c2 [Magnetofaba australis IT-1]